MDHYKSWGTLKKWLENNLCDELKNRVSFFLTKYHNVHNSYGRAAIRIDKKEAVIFSWIEMVHQERDTDQLWNEEGKKEYDLDRYSNILKEKWDENCTYCEQDFLSAVLEYRNLSIQDALHSDNMIILSLTIMDHRIGTRTLKKIEESKEYLEYPEWVRQFYQLRLSCGK